MQSDEDTLFTIPKEILEGALADDISSITNDDNILCIITDVINIACKDYTQHWKPHNTDYHNYYCRSYGSSHQYQNHSFHTFRSSVCGTYGQGCLSCTLVAEVYQKEKEFQPSQRDMWKLQASTIPTTNFPYSKTPKIDILELNIKEDSNHTYIWTTE